MAQEQPSAAHLDPEAPHVPSRLTKFITDDLAPLVAKHLRNDLSGVHKLRLLCKKARDAVDWELIIALRVGGTEAGTDAATQLRLACGMLARGTCRRLRELELTLPESEEEAVPGVAEQLFRSVPRNPNSHRPAITKLTVSLRLLTPEAARAAEAALPGLEELVVSCDGVDGRVDAPIDWRALDLTAALELAKQQQAALGLAVLLGPSPAPRAGTTEAAGGNAAGPAQTPLLPALRRLELGPNLDTLPLALAAALRAATQLRSLRLHLDLSLDSAATTLRRLSGMTQLEALELASRNAHRPARQRFTTQQVSSFAAALAPLSGSLRSLAISFGDRDGINAKCFTALRGLQELRLGGATVLASSLSGLTSLTRLHAGAVSRTDAEAGVGTRFRLPPRLRALRLSRPQAVEALAALMPLPSLTEVAAGDWQEPGDGGIGVVRLCFAQDASIDADGRLSPAGEEALCRTAAVLSAAHTLLLDGRWRKGGGSERILPPPSYPAPGFEGHGRWLSAWGANGLWRLLLAGVALSAADLATIARSFNCMRSLCLVRCSFPAGALPALAGLLHLIELRLEWPEGTELPDGLEGALWRLRVLAPKLRLIVQQRAVTFAT